MANKAMSTQMKVVVGESIIASSAATLSVMVLDVPVWAMFVGWISFFTRGLNLKQGAIKLVCVLAGGFPSPRAATPHPSPRMRNIFEEMGTSAQPLASWAMWA